MKHLHSTLRAALFIALASLGNAADAQDAPQRLEAVSLRAGMHSIRAEVARTPEQRATGLMFRSSMGTNEGMLFEFEQPAVQCFWMKNTLLPLSAAFIAEDGRIVGIEDMQPRTLDSHCSSEPVRHVLEMNAGWFAKRGIKPGSRLQGPPFGP